MKKAKAHSDQMESIFEHLCSSLTADSQLDLTVNFDWAILACESSLL